MCIRDRDQLIAELEMEYYRNGQILMETKIERDLERDCIDADIKTGREPFKSDVKKLDVLNRRVTRLTGRDQGIKSCIHYLMEHKRLGHGMAGPNTNQEDHKHIRRTINEEV